MEIWRYGDMKIWQYEDMETWIYGDMEIWRYGDMKIERNRDTADFMYMVLKVTLVQRRLSIYPQVHRWLWVPFS